MSSAGGGGGGGMESRQKASQYGYAQNAALVLQSERGKRDHSGVAEVQSIAAHKGAAQMMREMGSRAGQAHIADKDKDKAKK